MQLKKGKRTKKNHDGTSLTNKDLTSLLSSFLQEIKRDEASQKDEVLKAWYDIIDLKFVEQTKPLFFKKGTLFVAVRGGALYSFLNVQEKPKLLVKIQKRFPQVKDLVFRVA